MYWLLLQSARCEPQIQAHGRITYRGTPPDSTPAKAGAHLSAVTGAGKWVPAYAGMGLVKR